VELCESCSFGLYQCAECHHIVSHLEDSPYRGLVYLGPPNTWDEAYIVCEGCAGTDTDADTDADTDVEEGVDLCHTDADTQPLE
jgi:hypothetical protein